MKAWIRELEAVLAEFDPGGRIVQGRRHVMLVLTNGARVFTSRSPSDWRTLQNIRRELRRATKGT